MILLNQWRKILYDQSQAASEIKLVWKRLYFFLCLLKGTCQRQWKSVLHHFLLSEDYMIWEVCRCKLSQQNGDFLKSFQILRSKLRLVIWQWFKVENVCDISILMYNLPHCLLERFYSLVKISPNSLFTVFTCLFLIFYDSWIENRLSSPDIT